MKQALIISTLCVCLHAALTFTTQPSLAQQGQAWQISFAVSESTDVEVSIVDTRDSTVFRHLAAGRLGGKAPAPLSANTLHQTLVWDGKDDFGTAAAHPESLSLRVRAGMSVVFHQSAGFNPYAFSRIRGAASDREAGAFFIYGKVTLNMCALRQYDLDGRYVRTVFPYSGRLGANEVKGYGINMFPDGVHYAPKSSRLTTPEMDYTIMGNIVSLGGNPNTVNYNTTIASDAVNGQLAVINREGMDFLLVQSTGAVGQNGGSAPIYRVPLTTPSYPANMPIQVRISPDNRFFYITGASTRIMRSDLATGTSATAADIRSGVPISIAFDDSGHIFVSEPNRQRISKYDTLGQLLDSMSVDSPNLIEVDRKTGALYVLGQGGLRLTRYSSFRTGSASVACALPDSVKWMVLSESGSRPVACLAGKDNVWFVRDDGDSLSIIRDFSEGRVNTGFDRLAVDRVSEICYINDGQAGMFQVADWRDPRVLACSTNTGQRMWGGDYAVSPSQELYVRSGSSYSGPIDVYSPDPRHAYKRNAVSSLYGRMGPGSGDISYADRGFAVAPNGNVAAMYIKANTWVEYIVTLFGPSGSPIISSLIYPLPMACGGLKFDLQGNVYVGANIMDLKHETPGSGFAGDYGYWHGTGSVVKFPPSGGSISNTEPYVYQRKATNALKIYPQDMAPYSGDIGTENCACRSGRFDVDLYGRLFTPGTFACRINIADNEGNTLARAGNYGNADDPLENIPLAWPVAVAASEDYVYVTDMVNCRLMRLKMDYALDNLPGLTEHGTGVESADAVIGAHGGSFLKTQPNPFNSVVSIRLTGALKHNACIKVFDLSGRLVADLSGKTENGYTVWNAGGRASGIYIITAAKGNLSERKTIIYSK